MPHEIDMTRALIVSLKEWYREQREPLPVRNVCLVVGKFTCVEPDLLRSSFARQRMGTFLEKADLVIRETEFVAFCARCNAEYRPDIGLEYACPACRAPLGEVRSGRELKIERIDWEASTICRN
ncbi:MAG: hydrogenase maturation nickel metallochaperone HypA [Capsulimonadaceae bacterium]